MPCNADDNFSVRAGRCWSPCVQEVFDATMTTAPSSVVKKRFHVSSFFVALLDPKPENRYRYPYRYKYLYCNYVLSVRPDEGQILPGISVCSTDTSNVIITYQVFNGTMKVGVDFPPMLILVPVGIFLLWRVVWWRLINN
jgi:hypothetical protein